MTKTLKTPQKGFTLIELLLVVALVTISVGVTSDILLSLIRSYNKSQVTNEVEQSTNFISQKFTKELRNARSVTEINGEPPVAGDTGNVITFTDRANTEITYEVDNGLIDRTYDGGSPQSLNVNSIGGVSVACGGTGCFTLLQASPQVIQISLVMTQGGTATTKIFEGSISVEDTIVIRDTY